jgi:hypothetical protein
MDFENGETGALTTNLTGCGAGEIKRLCRKRWMIEKQYHTLKNKMRFESVTGKACMYAEKRAVCPAQGGYDEKHSSNSCLAWQAPQVEVYQTRFLRLKFMMLGLGTNAGPFSLPQRPCDPGP